MTLDLTELTPDVSWATYRPPKCSFNLLKNFKLVTSTWFDIECSSNDKEVGVSIESLQYL